MSFASTTVANSNNSALTSSSLINANNILFSFEKSAYNKETNNNNKNEDKNLKKQSTPIKLKPTKSESPPPKVIICKICSKKGHKEKECPTPDINKICSNCNKIGHISSNCKVIHVNFARPPKPQQPNQKEKKQRNQPKQQQQQPQQELEQEEQKQKIQTTTSSNSTTPSPTYSSPQLQPKQLKDEPIFDNKNSFELKKIEVETLKLSKELPNKQYILPNDDILFYDSEKLEFFINGLVNSKILSISIPFNNNNNSSNQYLPIIESLHKKNINIIFRIPIIPNLSSSTTCINSNEFQQQFKLTISKIINDLKPDGLIFTNLKLSHKETETEEEEKEKREKKVKREEQDVLCQNCKEMMIENALNPCDLKDNLRFNDYSIDQFKRFISQSIITITTNQTTA
ncbi:hypothetical protein ACTA71_011127, partial [Dictyostelium dimigraforme]